MYNIQLFVARINVLPFFPNESASQISGAQGLERKSAWGKVSCVERSKRKSSRFWGR